MFNTVLYACGFLGTRVVKELRKHSMLHLNLCLFIYLGLCLTFAIARAFLQLQRGGATLQLRCMVPSAAASLVAEHGL